MRPRGETQRRYNEAIQSLSGKKSEKPASPNKISMKKSSNIVVRRLSRPQVVVQLWSACVFIRQQKQISNVVRVSAYMKRYHSLNFDEVETELTNTVKDNLLLMKTVVGNKGSKVGIEQDGYRMPPEEVEKDGHDWYCFMCHRGGEMVLCTSCHRVYHANCIDVTDFSNFVCYTCKCHEDKFHVKIPQEELNELLQFTCMRLKEKTRELHRIPHPNDEKWRYDTFVYHSMDLCTMEQKMRSGDYENLAEFYTDALQIVHNAEIYYGEKTIHALMAQQMMYDCEYDLTEIERCRSCYRMSNQKGDKHWFCQPCDPPHELVFAKQPRFQYWPAKVIKRDGDIFDVRFFGAHHQRAYIEPKDVKPITTPLHEMKAKKTPALAKALDELKLHQKLVADNSSGGNNKSSGKKRKMDNERHVNNSVESPVEEKLVPVTKRRRGPPRKLPKPKVAETKSEIKNDKDSEKLKKDKDSEKLRKDKDTEKLRKDKDSEKLRKDKDSEKLKKDKDSEKLKKEDREDPPTVPKRRKLKRDNSLKLDDDIHENNVQLKPKDGLTEELNVVSSSSQEVAVSFVTIATQTMPYVFKEADVEEVEEKPKKEAEKQPCQCATKYGEMFQKMKEKFETDYKVEKEAALKALAEKMKQEFDADRLKVAEINRLDSIKYRKKTEQLYKEAEEQERLAHETKIEAFKQQHQAEISATKKKQWCYNCEKEAIYHCCWNTAYCSVGCQQQHWHTEHKRICRRKRT